MHTGVCESLCWHQASFRNAAPVFTSFPSHRCYSFVLEICLSLFCLFVCFWPRHVAYGILVPRPGIETMPPVLGAWSFNHWNTREVPIHLLGEVVVCFLIIYLLVFGCAGSSLLHGLFFFSCSSQALEHRLNSWRPTGLVALRHVGSSWIKPVSPALAAAAAAKSLQLCPTLSDPMDCSLPGSSVHGTFQARVLEWGANAFSGTLSLELPFSLDHNIFIFYLKQSINSFGMKPILVTFIMF